MKRLSSIAIGLLLLTEVFAQKQKAALEGASQKILNLAFTYNYQLPAGNWAGRFGPHHAIGFGGLLKSRSNWLFGMDASFLFGSEIRETTIFDKLLTGGGYLSTRTGQPGEYAVNMRGLSGFVSGGRIFSPGRFNRNHGFVLMAGAGMLQHYININVANNDIPQLNTDAEKAGYDRLTRGFALNEFAGYYFQSRNRFINFFIGVQLMQAFTRNVRGFNYDTGMADKEQKMDNMTAVRFGWMIPIYLATKNENEFYFK